MKLRGPSRHVLTLVALTVLGCSGRAPDAGSAPRPDPAAPPPDPADLIPAEVPSDAQFCRRDETGGNLLVTVENIGEATSRTSTTAVVYFFRDGTFEGRTRTTGPIAGGRSERLSFEIVDGCFDPDCDFRITVDQTNQVPEGSTGERNNSVRGQCVG